MAQEKDLRQFKFLNKDDRPEEITPEEISDALNFRLSSSSEQNEQGVAETLQGELMVDIVGSAIYYGGAIGGHFLYEGYPEKLIGTQVWMAKNWDANYPGSKVYDDLEANRAIYGGLYNWNQVTAVDFCPVGWHVPTMAEINTLLTYLGGDAVAGGKMKEPDTLHWQTPNTGGSDSSGFKALPGGKFDSVFGLVGLNAKFWSKDTPAGVVTDYFLPSKDEFNAMKVELYDHGLGDFHGSVYYWTSSEFNYTSVWMQVMDTGLQQVNTKGGTQLIRACRAFTSTINYNVRDIGPAGGYIFWKSGNDYLEADTADQIQAVWSNIVNIAIGTTDTAIGTGIANTNMIIAQTGHVNSAALVCKTYSGLTNVKTTLSLAYNTAAIIREAALATYYRSVRLVKDVNTLTPTKPSTAYSVLLNGNCLDQENRKLYTFYLDTYYNEAWIFETDIDTYDQGVVFFGATNQLGFDGLFKIYNARVVQGTLIWTDNKNPVYQMNIARAKKSFYHGIGYGLYPVVDEWNEVRVYKVGEIVWKGRHFYKNLIGTATLDPLDYPTYWLQLCLVEEAYYSTKQENYYFAPMPPAFGPLPQYFSDSSRKPNNLRQTIWQFAYRYVYMDYRKSTFSPACVPDMPNSEEVISTGLANELSELNNGIKLKINTGGEEVRKVEIIGRNSNDPSTWFLIDVIDLFDELEGTAQKTFDLVSKALKCDISITFPDAVVVNNAPASQTQIDMTIAILAPAVTNSEPISQNQMGMNMIMLDPLVTNNSPMIQETIGVAITFPDPVVLVQ